VTTIVSEARSKVEGFVTVTVAAGPAPGSAATAHTAVAAVASVITVQRMG
jgi:hypothetical protein